MTMNEHIAAPPGWTKDDKTKTGKCAQCGYKIRGRMWSYRCPDYGCRICCKCIEAAPDRRQYDVAAAAWQLSVSGCWSCKFDGGIDPKFAQDHPRPPPIKRIEEEMKTRESKGLPPLRTTTKVKIRNSHNAMSVLDTTSTSPAGDMEGETSIPLMTSERLRRPDLKRKNYRESDSDDDDGDVFVDGPLSKRKKHNKSGFLLDLSGRGKHVSSLSHLQGATTVIVGAGVVGLCIARELALEMKQASVDHRIVVVELRQSYCELASGHCAGFLSTSGMPEDWRLLANEAKRWWLNVMGSSEVRQNLQFSTATQVMENGSNGRRNIPSWLQQDIGLSSTSDSNAIARINSVRLSKWLYSQCEALGVEFRFNHEISDVDGAADGTFSCVWIRSNDSDNEAATKLQCKNLILAAGPFTTWIFNNHFENSPLELENHVQQSHWFHISTDALVMEGDETAIRLPNAAKDEKKLDNAILMVPNGSENVIAVSGIATRIEDEDLSSSLAQVPGSGKTERIRGIAARYLNTALVDVRDKSNVVERGRSQLSVANRMRPIIDRVSTPGSRKNTATKLPPGGNSSGVWLCYGFGKYGTMVAPSAARILVSMMIGERSEALSDENKFGVPGYTEPRVGGRWKGKAKAY